MQVTQTNIYLVKLEVIVRILYCRLHIIIKGLNNFGFISIF